MRIMSSVQLDQFVANSILDPENINNNSCVIDASVIHSMDNRSDSDALTPSDSPERNSGRLSNESNIGHQNSADLELPSMGGELLDPDDARSPSPLFSSEITGGLREENNDMICPYCHRTYRQPRLLYCLHALCEDCIIALLEGHSDGFVQGNDIDELEQRLTPEQKPPPPGVIRCPVCKQDSSVGNDARFAHGMLLDYVTINLLDAQAIDKVDICCESCKTKESAVARCQDCANFLCTNCVAAHNFMRCFDGHKVVKFEEIKRAQESGEGLYIHRPIFCQEHTAEQLRFFCTTCHIPVCNECVMTNHKPPEHGTQKVDSETDDRIRKHLQAIINTGTDRVNHCQTAECNIESRACELKNSVEAAREAIDQNFDMFKEALEARRLELHGELESLHSQHEEHLATAMHNFSRTSQKIADASKFTERLLKYASTMELLVSEKAVTQQFNQLQHSVPKADIAVNITFEASKQQFEQGLKTSCGTFNSDLFGPVANQYSEIARYIAASSTSPQHPPSAWQSPPRFNVSQPLEMSTFPQQSIAVQMASSQPATDQVFARNNVAQPPGPQGSSWNGFQQPIVGNVATSGVGFGGYGGYPQQQIPIPTSGQNMMGFVYPQPPGSAPAPQFQPAGSAEGSGENLLFNNLVNLGLARLEEVGETSTTPAPPLALDGLGANSSAVYSSYSMQKGGDFHTPSTENTSPSPLNFYQLRSAAPTPSISAEANATSFVPNTIQSSIANSYAGGSGRSSATPLDCGPGGFGGLINGGGIGGPLGNSVSHALSVTVSSQSRVITPPQGEYGDLSNAFSSIHFPGASQMVGQSTFGGSTNPPVRNIRMASMQIKTKFGSLGPAHGQFNSPHGFCLGADEDIIVADTNNHRIQIFTKDGNFKGQFGVPGKEEGQLWYPRKVAVSRVRDFKFVVCDRGNERSRMQIFSRNGSFIKKIAIRYIDIVAGLCVDSEGHMVAVDSVSPTVFRIDESGELLKWFDCSDFMKEPSDIAVSYREYFVCDFKGHNVCVFSDEGQFLRRIGCDKITSFPNGIDISDAGDVLIGDSHGNKFHVSIFKKNGEFETEFDCPFVKVSRCCGLRISSGGDIITLAKNNHHVLVLHQLHL